MSFSLETVVPWGRSFDEYRRMFALSEEDLSRRILGCADGPASFNAEATARGSKVTSVDPLYRYDTLDIRDRILATYDRVIEQTRLNHDEFVWTEIGSVEELGRIRMNAMNRFLEDFELGRRQGRYRDAEVPTLAFDDNTFDLGLCSHFLFLYSTQLGTDFHLASALKLCRVAREVRIFPLVALDGKRSTLVADVIAAVTAAGYHASIQRVAYEFQRGANEMLVIRKCEDLKI